MKAKIEIKTERDLRLFLWLNRNNVEIINYVETSSLSNYNLDKIYSENISVASNAINKTFSTFSDDPDQLHYYSLGFERAKERVLPLKEFNWLRKCNDACYFAWVFIRTFCKENEFLFNVVIQNNPEIKTYTIYNHLDLPIYPVSHQERIQSIIDFFDRVDLHLIRKIKLMCFIKDKWNQRYNLKNSLPLDKKEKQKCEWLWGYINKDKNNVIRGSRKTEIPKVINSGGNEGAINYIATHFHSPSFLSLFRPSGNNEVYLALNCIYIFLYCRDQNFIPRMKKAWESSVFRKSKKIKTKRKIIQIENSNELMPGFLKNTNVEHPFSENYEKRMKAKEIMREITEKINSDILDDNPDVGGAPPWFG